MGRTAMTDKTIDLDHSSRKGGSEIHGSPLTVGVVPASKKALQLRQDELKTQMVAAQAANWREAAREARFSLTLR